jgi:3-oxoacyl-[acyl-carrier protein] reductase
MSDDRLAVVTGAAHGIGAAIAARLARDGLEVLLLDVDLPAAAQAADAINASGGRARAWRCDVVREADVKAVFARIGSEPPRRMVLVNNAGFARDGGLNETGFAEWNAVIGVHLTGSYLMSRAAAAGMRSAGWGRIVCISSISALGHAGRANYCAAKAGLHGLVRSLAVELGPDGVTVNAVAPGLVVTAMTTATAQRKGLSLEAHLAQATAQIPVGRAGRPEDVANAVAFFADEAAGFVTGQILYVSGGPAG